MLKKEILLGRYHVFDTKKEEVVFSSIAEYEVDDYIKTFGGK